MSIYQGALFSRRKGGWRALKKGEISRGERTHLSHLIEQMGNSCPISGQPSSQNTPVAAFPLARSPSPSRAPPSPLYRRAAFPSLVLSHSRHTGRGTRPSKGDLVPGGVSIFPSRLDRAGGRGGRLTRDGHSRKKSSAVAFPQPGAPSTRVKSPTPLRGKGSWQCLLWGRSLTECPGRSPSCW